MGSNILSERQLTINDSKVIIKYGDIFAQDGLKVIPFNEYFDTLVDDKIIAHETLNGKFIDNYVDDVSHLDLEIQAQIGFQSFKVGETKRRYGKTTQCRLGSIVKYNDFLLLAFSKFNYKDEAELTSNNYANCLSNFWSEVRRVYAAHPVSLPLLGSGITNIDTMSNQQLLQEIIYTFGNSKVKLLKGVNIILDESVRESIDLMHIKR